MISPRFRRTGSLFIVTLLICSLLPGQLVLAQTVTPATPQQTTGSGLAAERAMPSGQASGQGTYLPYQNQRTETGMPVYASGHPGSGIRPLTGTPAWGNPPARLSGVEAYPPFGASLFQGFFAGTYYSGTNENYTVMAGDRIRIHIWGAHTYSDVLMVDQQGNIFIPEVGPIQVMGVKHSSLQGRIAANLAETFLTNVNVYADLLSAQPVAVYVTGFVERPGRYAGGPTDSVLYYLDRAGGIIADRGSYRDIRIQRGNRTVAQADLYSFILDGNLPTHALHDGDVIVVGPRRASVTADGLIPQFASYESGKTAFTGAELSRFAAPLPAVSHVSVTGARDSKPFHVYMSLADFANFNLAANDRVEFLADRPGETIMVSVSGAVLGSTRYPVLRNTNLRALLAYVAVDQNLSNLEGIYIKRRSVVDQQRKTLQEALYRLEKSVLTNTSVNVEGANIRMQEAQLVQNFVERARHLEPDGVVVVTRDGVIADIILENGDEIVIPQRSDIVQVTGEVIIPKAIVYSDGWSAKNYVASAGGFSERADASNILVAHPNGEIAKASNTLIMPGDLLMVMPKYDRKGFSILKDIIQILYQLAIATKVVIDI